MDEFNTRKPMNLRKRGIYLLPNLFTTGALFAGFYAIVQAMNGKFEHAAVAIFIAMVLDGLDGRVARLTPLSVACAERITATSNSNGDECSSSVVGWGFAACRRKNISRRFAGFIVR